MEESEEKGRESGDDGEGRILFYQIGGEVFVSCKEKREENIGRVTLPRNTRTRDRRVTTHRPLLLFPNVEWVGTIPPSPPN